MAVIRYQCDVCNRIIDVPQNKKGLEVMQRCIITDGCRGKLSQIDVKVDHLRGNFPERVETLDDFVKRQTLYNHKQAVKLTEWLVQHDLGVVPSVQVFVERPKNINLNTIDITTVDPNSLIELIEVIPLAIETINGNSSRLIFEQPEKGIAQLIAKSTKSKYIANEIVESELTSIDFTSNSELTLATKNNDTTVDIVLTFKTPDGLFFDVPYTVDNVSIESAWSDFGEALISGGKYTIRSFNFKNNDPIFHTDIPNGSSVYLKSLNGFALNRKEVLGLLTRPPYKVQDKVLDKFFDFQKVTEASLKTQLIFNENDLLIEENQLSFVFPKILRI